MSTLDSKPTFGAIIVLGGDIKHTKEGWCTDNEDRHGITDAYLRIRAAQMLQVRNGCPVIVSGGATSAEGPEPKPTIARIMKKELIELGIAPSMIREEDTSQNTYQQLVNCLSIINSGDIVGPIGIVSNWWHLLRIEAMLNAPRAHYSHLPHLAKAYGDVNFVSAEHTILADRIVIERKGVADIRAGTYKLG